MRKTSEPASRAALRGGWDGEPAVGAVVTRGSPDTTPDLPVISVRTSVSSSPCAWIALAVGLSFAVRSVAALLRPGPWILPDELVYVDLARSLADGHAPGVRGVTTVAWGVVYPLLIAPAWALFGDPLTAYRATAVINAFVMSLAAVPAFFFARLFVAQRAAVLVSWGTILVPTMVFTGTAMTENAAYPLFLLALWLIGRVVRSPSAFGQLAALGSICLLAVTRTQGAVLLPVLVVAAVVYAVTLGPGARRSYVRRFGPAGAVVLGATLLAAVAYIGRGGTDALGGRSGVIGAAAVGEVPGQFALHVGGLLLTVAVLPLLASLVVVVLGLSRTAPEPQRLFAAVALPTLLAVIGVVSFVGTAIDIADVEGVNDRYVVYVVPVALVGFALWSESLRPPRAVAAVFVAGAVVLLSLLPYGRLAVDATFYAPSLAPWVALPHSIAPVAVGACALCLGLAWIGLGPRGVRTFSLLTASWLAVLAFIAAAAHQQHARTAAAPFAESQPWVSAAVPAGEVVPALWRTSRTPTSDADYYDLMMTAVLNRPVGSILRLGPATSYENVVPTVAVRVRRGGILVTPRRTVVRARFVLVPCSLRVAGRPWARSADGRSTLVRVDGAIRVVEQRACPPRR